MNAIFRMALPIFGIALISFSFCFTSCQSPAGETEHPHTISLFDYLIQQDIDAVELEMDFGYLANTDTEDSYKAGTLKLLSEGPIATIPVMTKPRGKTRRAICDFPPIKLKLDTAVNLGSQVIHEEKYKLVTHCNFNSNGEELVLREHAAYKIYNVLTNKGFRARLLKVKYKDVNGGLAPSTHWAIILESKKSLERRLKASELAEHEPLKKVNVNDYNTFVLYQFMIGNTDWNLKNRHNVKLMMEDKGLPFPVPYDFDYSGLVDAPYAKPYPTMPIQTVKDRFFQWRGKDRQILQPTIELFKSRQAEILESCELLRQEYPQAWSEMISYIKGFYQEVDQLLIEQDRMVFAQDDHSSLPG